MSRDPQAPDGGYALTPDNGAEQSSMDASHASTAHHEELLRTEALAAKRGNRAVARFAVVGLIAAIAVGVATWRSSVPDSDSARRSNVVDVSAPSALNTSAPESPAPSPSRTTTNSPAPLPYAGPVSGLAQLSEDPYLPPNSWNGGATLGPAPRTNDKQDSGTNSNQTVIQTVSPERTTESAPETSESTDRNSLLPTIPLPTIPTWPNGSSEQSSEPSQPATSDTDKPSDEPGGSRVPGITTEPGEPSEPSEAESPQSAGLSAQQSQVEARNTGTPANTESRENAANAADAQSPTRTTPNR